AEGASMAIGGSGALPAIQLAGFCDGSVRPVGGRARRLDSFFRFEDAGFFGNLTLVDPAISGNTTQGWTGLVNLTDQDGNSLTGVLIGLLRPGETALHGILIEQDGIGEFAGAPGTGTATINWGSGFSGPFHAMFQVTPFPTSQKH